MTQYGVETSSDRPGFEARVK